MNLKYLVTGSLGVDPALVEKQNNYPRFNLLVKTSKTDQEILERIKKRARILEKLTASSKSVNVRSLVEDEQGRNVESIESETDHKPDQFLSTLFTKVKDETYHKSDQFFHTIHSFR